MPTFFHPFQCKTLFCTQWFYEHFSSVKMTMRKRQAIKHKTLKHYPNFEHWCIHFQVFIPWDEWKRKLLHIDTQWTEVSWIFLLSEKTALENRESRPTHIHESDAMQSIWEISANVLSPDTRMRSCLQWCISFANVSISFDHHFSSYIGTSGKGKRFRKWFIQLLLNGSNPNDGHGL